MNVEMKPENLQSIVLKNDCKYELELIRLNSGCLLAVAGAPVYVP